MRLWHVQLYMSNYWGVLLFRFSGYVQCLVCYGFGFAGLEWVSVASVVIILFIMFIYTYGLRAKHS